MVIMLLIPFLAQAIVLLVSLHKLHPGSVPEEATLYNLHPGSVPKEEIYPLHPGSVPETSNASGVKIASTLLLSCASTKRACITLK
jgi:hypothetical protein